MIVNITAHSHLFALDNGNYLILTGSIEPETIALMNCIISFRRLVERNRIKWKVKDLGEAIVGVIEWRLAKTKSQLYVAS